MLPSLVVRSLTWAWDAGCGCTLGGTAVQTPLLRVDSPKLVCPHRMLTTPPWSAGHTPAPVL